MASNIVRDIATFILILHFHIIKGLIYIKKSLSLFPLHKMLSTIYIKWEITQSTTCCCWCLVGVWFPSKNLAAIHNCHNRPLSNAFIITIIINLFRWLICSPFIEKEDTRPKCRCNYDLRV